ncbi:MAG TPA: hypothetical protein VGG62_17795 [Terracidiphilus sp.]
MTCPHCEKELTPEEVKSLWGRYTSSLVTNFHAGPGRPPYKKRCKCGKMTQDRARKLKHKCPPQKKAA